MKGAPASHYKRTYKSIPFPDKPHNTNSFIHNHLATQSITQRQPNHILHEQPPPIDNSELLLPRKMRCALARLRCGHHPSILQFQNRIPTHPTCNYCFIAPLTTTHLLLGCPALSPQRSLHGIRSLSDLWERPADVAGFLWSIGFVQEDESGLP